MARKQRTDAEKIGNALVRGAERGRVNGSVAAYVAKFKGGPEEVTANANVGRVLATLEESRKLHQLGLLNIELGRKDEAKRCARKLEKDGEYSSAVEIFIKIEDVKGVERCAEGLRAQGYHREAGDALRDVGNPLEAADCYLEGARKSQELGLGGEAQVDLYYDAADIYTGLGLDVTAAEIAEELVKLGEFKTAGIIFTEIKRYEEAGECLSRGIDLASAAENFLVAGRRGDARECAEGLEREGDFLGAAHIYENLGDKEKQFDALVLGGNIDRALEVKLPRL